MASLAAQIRLRPIRFGFLVIPEDAKSLLEVFRVNTCIWGGKFNPIIPYLRRVPKWWDRHGHRFETAPQIMHGYLDFFEPDFLVESVPGLAATLEFDTKRVLSLSEVLQHEGDRDNRGHGQSVLALYRDRYRKVFQFALRHEHDIVEVTAEDGAFAAAAACLTGGFPDDDNLGYFRRAFVEAFEPKPVELNGETLARLYESGFTSALQLGHWGIDVDGDGWHEPAIFVFNAQDPKDLIDFWNLRAVRRNVLPIPRQWLPELSAFCRKSIAANFRPVPGNSHGVMIRQTVMFGRGIPSDAIEPLFEEHLRVDVDGANVRQDWYPAIWQRPSTHGPRDRRPTLVAARGDASPTSTESALHFNCLCPDWSEEYGSEHRWANVVGMEDWSFRDVSATVFPNDRRRGFVPRLGIGREHTLSTTEGIVIFPSFKNIAERWELPDGSVAIGEWLESNGIASRPSDAGRATEQIVQTLGGFNRVGDLAKKPILEALDEMSRRPLTRSAHHQKFRNQIDSAVKGDIWRSRSFETLVQGGAVELGLEVRCDKCSNWSWFALNQLGYKLQCSLCLRTTAFPINDPGKSENARWAYRVVGPFALPNYARGGYAAALALRCLAGVVGGRHHAQTTWCAGRELAIGADQKVEADFVLWYQRRSSLSHGQDSPTEIVFGEAKSFGRDAFDAEDVENLKAIAERFPGAFLVFATLRQPEELSSFELSAIRKLAVWGREYVRRDWRTRAPVVVLTGIELFAGFSLPDSWKELGGRHSEFSKASWLRADNLRTLADLTQQLYLDLPPYSAWRQAKWEANRERRKARVDAQPPAGAVPPSQRS